MTHEELIKDFYRELNTDNILEFMKDVRIKQFIDKETLYEKQYILYDKIVKCDDIENILRLEETKKFVILKKEEEKFIKKNFENGLYHSFFNTSSLVSNVKIDREYYIYNDFYELLFQLDRKTLCYVLDANNFSSLNELITSLLSSCESLFEKTLETKIKVLEDNYRKESFKRNSEVIKNVLTSDKLEDITRFLYEEYFIDKNAVPIYDHLKDSLIDFDYDLLNEIIKKIDLYKKPCEYSNFHGNEN